MATRTSWREVAKLVAEAEVQADDAVTLDTYRWNLLEASAHLSNAKLVINAPTPVLDQTEAELLDSLESATNDSIARFLADLAPGIMGSQGRSR